MLEALQQPLKVEVVHQGTALLGPLIIASAALVAAVVAAYWQRRHLDHDTAVRDQEHAREVIASVAASIAGAINAMAAFSVATTEADKKGLEAQKREAAIDPDHATATQIDAAKDALRRQAKAVERVIESRHETSPYLDQLLANTISLRIALGQTSPAAKKYEDLLAAFFNRFSYLSPDNQSQRERDGKGDAEGWLRQPLRQFEEACEEWSIKTRSPKRFGRRQG